MKNNQSIRIEKEIEAATKEGIEGVNIVSVSEQGDFLFEVVGHPGSPFAGNRYLVLFKFGKDYPFSPPAMQFMTSIFHPNISKEGYVCMNILQDDWSPALSARTVILSMMAVLWDPTTQNPFNPEAASCMMNNKKKYMEMNKNTKPTATYPEIMEALTQTNGLTWQNVKALKENSENSVFRATQTLLRKRVNLHLPPGYQLKPTFK